MFVEEHLGASTGVNKQFPLHLNGSFSPSPLSELLHFQQQYPRTSNKDHALTFTSKIGHKLVLYEYKHPHEVLITYIQNLKQRASPMDKWMDWDGL